MRYCCPILLLLFMVSCKRYEKRRPYTFPDTATSVVADTVTDTVRAPVAIANSTATPEQIVAFAQTLLGTPYVYACSDPTKGFDCSGFINYVFNHFGIEVPRSSVDFTNVGTDIPLSNARPGDLILFTGTNANIRTVGHIGIIVANDATGTSFIHSSSGKDNAVIITPLNERYMARYMKVIRIVK
jgi:cell wall-associated NlpC family hydrolase